MAHVSKCTTSVVDADSPAACRPKVDVLILSGGQSRRMGQDKAWIEWQGRALILRVADRARSQRVVQPSTLWVSCSTRNLEKARLYFENTLLDNPAFQGDGPLAGIHAGMDASRSDWLWVLPCDAVSFSDDLLSRLLSLALSEPEIDAVTLSSHDHDGTVQSHPVWALISRRTLPMLTQCLEKKCLKVASFLESINTRTLALRPNEILSNINRPEDLPDDSVKSADDSW